ncbi:hypothetical protein CB0940_03599 [Cercospora beticola]|uniref:C2H2-type domain-containing protein n=2 Tax=Cercospora beticola TaxID=122368 RepID=A0A2G5I550_CERBT|nr:hypothetical protein CB0940_03599 [Cercospora beticola]PIA99622.1 hypothetical protein CB0940_03599 [Cercospora beticola]
MMEGTSFCSPQTGRDSLSANTIDSFMLSLVPSDGYMQPETTPEIYSQAMRLLLDLRQQVQQTMDDALVNGYISIDAAATLGHEIAGHFTTAIRKTTLTTTLVSTEINSQPTDFHGAWATANFAAPIEPPSLEGTDIVAAVASTPAPLASIPSSNICRADVLPAKSSATNSVTRVTGARLSTTTSTRRKRMPKIQGAYPCTPCNRVYDRFGDLTKHAAVHEPGKRTSYRCHLCGKGFAYPEDLRRHSSRPNSACQTLPSTPSTLSPTEVANLTMVDHGYFPPVEEYQARTSKPRCAPAPLLPTPGTHDSDLPIFGTDTLATIPDMSEPMPLQTCSCPISDACILETLALLQGSLSLLRQACLLQDFVDARLSALLAEPCQLKTCIIDLLPDLDSFETPKTGSETSVLLRRDSFLPTPENSDICSFVRQRLNDLLLDPVDAFAPIQHCLHALLTMFGFESVEFRAHLRHLKATKADDEIDLMCQAYDHLARSTLKVYSSQLDEKVDTLQSAIEGVAAQINMGNEIKSASTGEIVEFVAAEKRFSFTTAKLISIPGNDACA